MLSVVIASSVSWIPVWMRYKQVMQDTMLGEPAGPDGMSPRHTVSLIQQQMIQ